MKTVIDAGDAPAGGFVSFEGESIVFGAGDLDIPLVLRPVALDQNFDNYSVEYTFADGAKLFLYGTMAGEDPQAGEEQYVAPASAEAVPAPGYAESKADHASDPQTAEKDPTTVSDLLRNRALATHKGAASGSAAAVGDAPISGGFEDEATRARLAEMTRRASEQVRSLATQLEAAEESLEEQRANQYGDAVP